MPQLFFFPLISVDCVDNRKGARMHERWMSIVNCCKYVTLRGLIRREESEVGRHKNSSREFTATWLLAVSCFGDQRIPIYIGNLVGISLWIRLAVMRYGLRKMA